MEIVVMIATLTMAAVLLWAGLEKARRLSFVASTMRQLGVPVRAARVGAPLLVALELAVAIGLIFRPASAVTLAGVLLLSGAFTTSGLIALSRRQTIHCGCFGPSSSGQLGMNQLAAFPVWMGGIALVWTSSPPDPALLEGAFSLALVALAMAAVRLVSASGAAMVARGDRRSAEEMLVWLQ